MYALYLVCIVVSKNSQCEFVRLYLLTFLALPCLSLGMRKAALFAMNSHCGDYLWYRKMNIAFDNLNFLFKCPK